MSKSKKRKPQQKQAVAEPTSPSRSRRLPIGVVVVLVVVGIGLGAGAFVMFGRTSGVGGGTGDGGFAKDGPPNVLLITYDTTRSDYIGCYGRDGARTPNTDRLAAEGTRFTRCTTCSPLTTPSHASILTGAYPFVHGVRHNGNRRLPGVFTTIPEVLRSVGYRTGASVAAFVVNRQFGLDQGFEAYYDVEATTGPAAMQAERAGDEVCNDAIAMLRSAAPGPVFIWVHFYDPHDSVPLENYKDEIAFMDVQVGRLLQALDDHGIEDNTLVAVVADHGEGLGDHQEDFHGDFLYQTTLNAPMLIRYPKVVPAGRVVDAQVRTIDVGPTILDLAGAPPLPDAQGTSLASLIRGETEDLQLVAYAESFKSNLEFGLSPIRSLAAEGWKYVHAPEPELYDLSGDPAELRNVIDEHPDRADRFRRAMYDLLAAAPPPPAEGDVDLTAEERSRLESLGYLGSGGALPDVESELELFEPVGADPKAYRDAIRLFGLSATSLKSGMIEQATEQLQDVVRQMPDAALAHGHLGFALQSLGRFDEAAEHYRRALEIDPDYVHIRKMYAGLFIQQREWADAVAQFDLIIPRSAYDPEMFYGMGMAKTSLGQLADARPYFEEALRMSPDTARYNFGMGMLCGREKAYEEAARYFRQVLELDPDHANARRYLQESVNRIGRPAGG